MEVALMGGGGGGPTYRGPEEPFGSKIERSIEEIKEKSDLTNLKNQEDEVKESVKEEMDKASEKIPWDHNDHSIKHVERVLEQFPKIIKKLEEISYSKEFLQGENLSDLDKEILKFAIILHDIGYSKSIKEHSTASKDYINKLNRGIEESIIKDIALIAQLHTPEGIKKLGGNSLSDLVNKGKINDRIAYLASILTLSDALDAGKQRVLRNSQGQLAKDVIEKIKAENSKAKAESKLEHWFGHQGFSNPNLKREDTNLNLNFELNSKLSEKYSTKIAFRVFDLITDITSSHLSSSEKFKLQLNIRSKNVELAKKWYNENKLMFESEEHLSKRVKYEQIKEVKK